MHRHLLAALCALAATLCLAAAGAPAFGATILTGTPSALTAAFRAAACGDVIAHAGEVAKWRPGTPTWDCRANPVIITAADPASPPVFTGGVTGDKWPGVTFRGVTFDIRDGGAESSTAVLLYAGGGISFEGNTFIGLSEPTLTAAGTTSLGGIGYGVSARGVQGLTVRKNTFRDLPKGLVLLDVTDALVADNDMFDITTDNIQYGGLVRGEIIRNLLLKKALPDASGAHPDCIQGLKGGRPSVDVTIADNLCRGTAVGKASQGVFGADDLTNDNIAIRGNTVLDMAYRAVGADGQRVDIVGNTALSQRPADYAGLWWGGASGEVSGNVANRLMSAMPPGSVTTLVPRSTAAEIDAAQAKWMAKFRVAAPPTVEPAPDPRDAQLADMTARIERLLAERAWTLAKAWEARRARAKNAPIEEIIEKLSAPAP